jgi:hypothetical protein
MHLIQTGGHVWILDKFLSKNLQKSGALWELQLCAGPSGNDIPIVKHSKWVGNFAQEGLKMA